MNDIVSVDPRTGGTVEVVGSETGTGGVDALCRAAARAGRAFGADRAERARLLHAVADALDGRREEIVDTADRETALGRTRLAGELTRTTYQIRLFAAAVTDGGYLEAIIDHPADTPMGLRPDLRRMLVPIGPVAVFGASNFPLAFGALGGDTAAALAAGCPVVVKAHPSHPATSRLVVEIANGAGLPAGVLGLVYGQQAGADLVQHPAIRAVGFTGSLRGGRALHDLAAARPDPIPFYGELGSINPVVVTPAAATERGDDIAAGLVASFTLGNGQFCTKPGLVFLPAGARLHEDIAALVRQTPSGWLLDGRVQAGFSTRVGELGRHTTLLAHGRPAEGAGFLGTPALFAVSASTMDSDVTDEAFGPATVLVSYADTTELLEALGRLPASLTATIHTGTDETDLPALLLEALRDRTGRVVWNGFPTGVAVAAAMHHGGPYPASTSIHTSVGTTSIRRFLRPLAFQSTPDSQLPPELREGNPLRIPRMVDGRQQAS
ncbi:aldehyde dehydrogenase (NADP(+)) [Dactylosporangium sp. NPDC048998]|uniref:aldehyde dehydrogenase (NADP(+)) n=1 Tax=Dactylosporangium sp. NPDC048998 TaxID=3363976 RepID=UPI0037202E9F